MRIEIHLYHHEDKKINLKLTKIMATLAQLTEKLDALQTAVDAEQEQILAKIGELETTVEELRDQIANGGNSEQLQALADRIDTITNDIKSTVEDGPTPIEGEQPA